MISNETINTVTFEQALQHLDPGPLALDLETYSVDYPGSDEALDPTRGEIRLVSLCTPGGAPQLIDHMLTPIRSEQMAALLTDRLIVAHNAAFEGDWLKAKFGLCPAKIFDTLTAERILTNGLGLSNKLGDTLERELGLVLDKEVGASDWGGLFLTPDQLRYAENDVLHLHRLMSRQTDTLHKNGLWDVYLLEIALLVVAQHMQENGFRVARTILEEVRDEMAPIAAQQAAQLINVLGGSLFNVNNPTALKEALIAAGITVDNTAEETLAAHSNPICQQVLDYRDVEMQRRQAVALISAIGPDNRIHSHYNPMGAQSGRFSSSGPNLQQIKRAGKMRSAFVATPGRVLIVLDYSQLELRVAAFLSGDETMLEAFRRGDDMHKQTAAAVLSKPLETIDKEDRQTAKAVNFGLIFGQRAKGLVAYALANYGVRLTLKQAEKLRRKFFAHYHGVAQWHRTADLRAPFVLEGRTLLGRRRLPPKNADSWDKFQLLINFPVQGTAADGLKKALVRIYTELPHGVLIISCVHDEVILEAAPGVAEEVLLWAQQVMVEEMSSLLPGVPVEVKGRVCENWSEK